MSEYRIASRYAKSLLELAEEKNLVEEVHRDMELFSKVCKENKAFVRVMKAPIINHAKKLGILNQLFGDKLNELSMSMFQIITRKNREKVLPLSLIHI